MAEGGAAPEQPRISGAISLADLTLLASVFLIAACGLVYELAAGALASYLIGDSITQFSTVIGCYLAAMGLGSWLSRFVERQLVAVFLRVELLVGLIGGLMPAVLFWAFNQGPASAGLPAFRVLLVVLVITVGTLVGLEIPLVMRILRQHAGPGGVALKDLVAQVLTFDYLGALGVSLAFPLLLVPNLGLIRTGLLFGLLNAAVAVWALWMFRGELRRLRAHALACAAVLLTLSAAMTQADRLTTWAEERFYGERILFRTNSTYQRIVVSEGQAGLRLFLNGNLQFHERDEYRYHEALVHPAMAAHGAPRHVLVLGGGDGLAVREILKYPSVQQVTLVELDPEMTRLFGGHPRLRALNAESLSSPRLQIVHADAFGWLESQPDRYWDVIVIDFPDPSNFAIGKLYSTSFYQVVDQHLAAGGYAVIQTTSPLLARRSFWTVVSTLEAVGLQTHPYHAHVPSFGEWGFILASHRPWHDPDPQRLPAGLRFLTPPGLAALSDFPPDMARVPAEPNRLSDQGLVRTFEQEWGRVYH